MHAFVLMAGSVILGVVSLSTHSRMHLEATRDGERRGKARLFGMTALYAIVCTASIPAFGQYTPIRITAPWSQGDWWQPTTYEGHPPGRDQALDFNLVAPETVSDVWPYADE